MNLGDSQVRPRGDWEDGDRAGAGVSGGVRHADLDVEGAPGCGRAADGAPLSAAVRPGTWRNQNGIFSTDTGSLCSRFTDLRK